MKFGVVVFPGSNCDHDTYHALSHGMDQETRLLWHAETDLQGADAIIIPGGFSYGDYLRCGSIAKFSPIMTSIRQHAKEGKLVLGICNGFQILQEVGMLPGVMLRNAGLKFVCQHVHLRVDNDQTPFTESLHLGQILRIPIAHNEGNFFLPEDELSNLEKQGQIVLRYCDTEGNITSQANPNGSVGNIAGIKNQQGNVMGLMPHPERATETLLNSEDGRLIFESMMAHHSEN
jgi:phosphoribosylformylglycinamidine synthase